MTRTLVLLGLLGLMLVAAPWASLAPAPALEAQEEPADVSGRIPTIGWSNVPSASQNISGSFSVTVAKTGGTGGLGWVHIEYNNGSGWSTLANVTSPHTYSWDTTGFDDGFNYTLRAIGEQNGGGCCDYTNQIYSGTFGVFNNAGGGGNPLITNFTVTGAVGGNGSTSGTRAWVDTPIDGTLQLNYSVDTGNGSWPSYANLTGAPGPGGPPEDNSDPLDFHWNWTSGFFDEGQWTITLTVFDNESDTHIRFLYMGIDRSGPTVGTPVLDLGAGWHQETTVNFSGLNVGASDGGGSGIDHYEVRDSTETNWTDVGGTGSGSHSLLEGTRTLEFRAVDLLGNAGTPVTAQVQVDRTDPIEGTWTLPVVTTSTVGNVLLSHTASDADSGVDDGTSRLEYGFDSDGLGTTPDISGSWTNVAASSLTANLTGIDWSTKSNQYLFLRAIITDTAGNAITGGVESTVILPGLDLSWGNTTQDRIVVRPGGIVNLTTILETNEAYAGAVTVRLESAPADRDSSVNFTTVETRLLTAGSLSDSTETIQWNVTVSSTQALDLRLVIDPAGAIDERDEGNNDAYLIVQGIDPQLAGTVPGFAPSLAMIALAGLFMGVFLRRRDDDDA